MPLDQTKRLVEENAEHAVEIARMYGAQHASTLIPQPVQQPPQKEETSTTKGGLQDNYPEADPMLQLSILRELAATIDSGNDVNLLIEMVLEGISRGVGMDRALFAMLTPDRKLLKARYTVGWDAIKLKQEFSFDVLPESANVFRYLLETGEAIYVDSHSPYNIRIMVTESVKEIVDDAPFFAMPIKVAGRTIGIFYADRKPSKRELNEELYSSFKHFCQQAMLGIAHISARH